VTVIVWTPDVMATDSLALRGDTHYYVQKLWREGNAVIGLCGSSDYAMAWLAWYRAGRISADYPKCQDKDDYAIAVVAQEGYVYAYDRVPYPVRYEQPFAAWGCGREVALGALAMGASAVQAVEVAGKWCQGVGGPTQSERLR
jgi:hypothetical protein